MPDTSAPVLAHQLIYTNVEADLSPKRQRGFQVWLCSPELTPDQQRLTAKRLDDFRVPPGAGPQGNTLSRHVFFRLPEGGYFVIARTVPSAERDKFGRGGKFHAHAVLLSEEAFRALGSDPFRVIDGGFAFHSTPAEGMALENWRSGNLPPCEIRPANQSTDCVAVTQERLVELLDHLERADDKPVVVADKPERVLAFLRGCFAAFHSAARRKFEFDTLSTGAALAQIRYSVVGSFSADNLKTWSFRRYHKLDLGTGTLTPPLNAVGAVLPCDLVRSPGWKELADEEREAAFETGRALAAGRLDDIRVSGLGEAAVGVLSSSAAFRPAFESAVKARVAKDLHPGLAKLPGVLPEIMKHYEGKPVEVLDRLRVPVPRDVVAHALYEGLKSVTRMPETEILAGLGEWLSGGHPPPRLEIIFRRWRGTDGDLALIHRFLAEPEDETKRHKWFREWLAATLPEGNADDLIEQLAPDKEPTPAALRDARLWLALNPEPNPAWVELRLLTALHRGPDVLAAALHGLGKGSNADGWLVRVISGRFRDWFQPGWMNEGPDGVSVGLFLVPSRPADEKLLDAAVDLGTSVARRLLAALWPLTGKQGAAESTEPSAPPKTEAEYTALAGSELKSLSDKTVKFRDHLVTAEDDAFAWAGNQLIRKAYGSPVLRAVSAEVYFVGLKVEWVQFDKPSHQLATFEAVVGSVVREVSPGAVPDDVGRALEPRPARRFSWLLARLADPNGTERLRV
jgi:hypothetical protein